tara:strand:- start:530 stop:712 length:183 start_codon:yes stop_codon:yes gene_type:complete
MKISTIGDICVGVAIFSLIFCVGFIDGPTGYENDNWVGFSILATVGVVLGMLGLYLQQQD